MLKQLTKAEKNNDYFHFGTFSEKALNFLDNSNAFINILHGSVRSGKTIVMSTRWLTYILTSPHNTFLMSGKTRDTLERNVVNDFCKILNGEQIPYKYEKYNGKLIIFDKILGDKLIWLLGFNDEEAEDKIAGMTIGGWYCDESTRCPKSAIEMAISRCSLPGSKMFWSMNPGSPYHFIFTDYITNKKLIKTGDVKVWHFTLKDNPNLKKEYIEFLKRIYSKSILFYKRNILGEWVIAEGAIYDRFVEGENTFRNKQLKKYNNFYMCCDYGVSTVTTFGVMGIKQDSQGNYYDLLEETYYDAEEKGITQTDSERCKDIIKLQNKYKTTDLWLPHDAANLKSECEKNEEIIMNIHTYKPDTYRDIQIIQELIKTNHFRIHESCIHSVTQAQTYSWDIKKKAQGKEKPLKRNDHCPDMWRGGILGHRQSPRHSAGVAIINL